MVHKNSATLNQEYLQKYWSSVLQTWHQKRTSQKKQNDTYYVVAMATLSAPVSFCKKQISPFAIFLRGTEGLARHTHGSHIALTIPIRLLRVEDPCLQ